MERQVLKSTLQTRFERDSGSCIQQMCKRNRPLIVVNQIQNRLELHEPFLRFTRRKWPVGSENKMLVNQGFDVFVDKQYVLLPAFFRRVQHYSSSVFRPTLGVLKLKLIGSQIRKWFKSPCWEHSA